MRRLLPTLLAVLAACARADAPGPRDSTPAVFRRPTDTTGMAQALLEADRAFADSTAARGLEGWMQVYAEDAVRLTMGAEVAQGRAQVRAHDAPIFADSTVRLVWTPTSSGLFADGRHGFTTGTSAVVKLGRQAGAKPDTVQTGAYVTMWRRDRDGRWRVILDTGS